MTTTRRLPNGRYQVTLLFRNPQNELGNSRHIAMAQYLRNKRNLQRKPELKLEYDNVLQEYIDLGHMKPTIYNLNTSSNTPYYLPHHAVIKPDKIVFNADITEVYRLIQLNHTYTPYQGILFRKRVNEPIQDYELQTVTFGVNCAPNLAIRTLLRLAKDIQDTHPIASQILRDNIYGNDVLAGDHTVREAEIAQRQLITALESAGFPLRKWTSNTQQHLADLPKDHQLNADLLTLPESENPKTVGIRWNPKEDNFFFKAPKIERKPAYTKRAVLSDVAKLFEPAGMLAPIIISAEIMMQQIHLSLLNGTSFAVL